MSRLKYLARFQKGRIPPALFKEPASNRAPYLSMEYLRSQTDFPEFAETDGAVVARDNDIILLWDGSNAGEFIRAKHGVVSSTAALVRVSNVLPDYFFYLCKSLEPNIRAETVGMGIPHVNGDIVGDLQVALPPENKQRDIAVFLDRHTGELDRLIAEKEQLLALLTEKRRATIADFVMRGLSGPVSRRDSGILWLGEIPAHWDTVRARFLFAESNLPVRPDDQMVTCFRDGEVTLRSNRREEGFTNAVLELGYQGIRAGQLVLHSMDAFAGAIGVSDSDGKCSPEYVICDPITDRTDSYYYALLLREMALRNFIQAGCPAVRERAPRIRFNDFKDFLLPVPPLDEQREIVVKASEYLTPITALHAKATSTISLLLERRSALISAAVTGQLVMEASHAG